MLPQLSTEFKVNATLPHSYQLSKSRDGFFLFSVSCLWAHAPQHTYTLCSNLEGGTRVEASLQPLSQPDVQVGSAGCGATPPDTTLAPKAVTHSTVAHTRTLTISLRKGQAAQAQLRQAKQASPGTAPAWFAWTACTLVTPPQAPSGAPPPVPHCPQTCTRHNQRDLLLTAVLATT